MTASRCCSLGPFYRPKIGYADRADLCRQLLKSAQRSYAAFGPSRTPNLVNLVKFPSGTRGPQGPRTLGRVGFGSREGLNVARSPGTASTAGCPSRKACLWVICGRAGCFDSESAASLSGQGVESNDGSSLEPAKRRDSRSMAKTCVSSLRRF